MAVEVQHPKSPVRWLLRPRDRNTLVETYQLAEVLVLDETARRDVLLRAFRHYVLLGINIGIVCEREGRLLIECIEWAETDVIRASLFRLNCQLLRIMAGMTTCDQACCCDCAATLPHLACTVDVNRLRSCHCGDTEAPEQRNGGRDGQDNHDN